MDSARPTIGRDPEGAECLHTINPTGAPRDVRAAGVPADLASASNQTLSAAEGARGHGSSEDLTTAGSAIPGADSVGHLSELGTSWDDEVEGWADSVAAFGSQIAAARADFQGTDGAVGGLFGGLLPGTSGGN